MSTTVLIMALLAGSSAAASAAEEQLASFGDPSLRAAVDARTRPLYEAAGRPEAQRSFLMTRANLLAVPGAQGMEATAVTVDGSPGRIVASVWTARGKYSVEYYRDKEALLFVYETFAYFEEDAPRGAWRNFMGLAAWERRTWFDDRQAVGYAEVHGRNAPRPGSDGARLVAQSRRLAEAMRDRRAARVTEPGGTPKAARNASVK